jgi:hypothetical protein
VNAADSLHGSGGGAYRLRKWYCDFLTPRLEYCFLYYAEVRILGKTFRSCTLHRAVPGGTPPVTRTIPVEFAEEEHRGETALSVRFTGGRIVLSRGIGTIDLSGGGTILHLQFVPHVAFGSAPVVIQKRRSPHILWTPLHLRDTVAGSLAIDGVVTEAKGCAGYIDYLESTFLPPLVPVRTLHWGRLHHPEADLVYMRAAAEGGRPVWSRALVRAGGSTGDWEQIDIIPLEGGGYTLSGSTLSGRIGLTVRHSAAVQEGGFVDHLKFRSPILRSVVKKVTRNPRSTKWLSYADLTLEHGGTLREIRNAPLIDECAYL